MQHCLIPSAYFLTTTQRHTSSSDGSLSLIVRSVYCWETKMASKLISGNSESGYNEGNEVMDRLYYTLTLTVVHSVGVITLSHTLSGNSESGYNELWNIA